MWIPFVILAYRIRFYVPLSLATIERSFRIFRQSIYDESLQQLKELKKPSGKIEIDEALFGGYRKGSKHGLGSEGKNPCIWNISEKLKDHHVCCIGQKTTRYANSIN